MQHDQTPGFQIGKIHYSRDSKIAADTKNSKTIKINFFSRMAWYIWLKFCCSISGTLMFSVVKVKKKSVVELGHSDPFENLR